MVLSFVAAGAGITKVLPICEAVILSNWGNKKFVMHQFIIYVIIYA
jgi:hypothetical protein